MCFSPRQKTRLLEMTGSKYFKATLAEPALKEDATSKKISYPLIIVSVLMEM